MAISFHSFVAFFILFALPYVFYSVPITPEIVQSMNRISSATSSLIVSLELENILQMYKSLFIDKETIRKVSIQLYRYDLPFPPEKEEIYLPNKNITTEITEDIDIFHSRYHNL